MSGQLEILDVLTVISFMLQVQNQNRIIGIEDIQGEVNRAVGEIHAHLEAQDEKLSKIIERIERHEVD